MTEAHIGQRVRIVRGSHAGRTGVVIKVNGAKTVELRIDPNGNVVAGHTGHFTLWSVKIARLEGSE